MIMSKSPIALAVAVAIAGAVGTASAAQDPATGATDLFIVVWNPSTTKSLIQDMGTNWSFANLTTTFSNPGFTISGQLDNGNLSDPTLGIGAAGANGYQFSAFAGNLSGTSAHSFQGRSLILGQNSSTATQQLTNGQSINSIGLGKLAPYVEGTLPGTNLISVNADDGTAGSKYWAASANANAPGNPTLFEYANQYPGNAQTAGGALDLQWYLSTTDTASDTAQLTTLGSSHGGLLTISGSTATWTSTVGAVPLPAALWLLGSGLVGLGALGRRRRQAAEATAVA